MRKLPLYRRTMGRKSIHSPSRNMFGVRSRRRYMRESAMADRDHQVEKAMQKVNDAIKAAGYHTDGWDYAGDVDFYNENTDMYDEYDAIIDVITPDSNYDKLKRIAEKVLGNVRMDCDTNVDWADHTDLNMTGLLITFYF